MCTSSGSNINDYIIQHHTHTHTDTGTAITHTYTHRHTHNTQRLAHTHTHTHIHRVTHVHMHTYIKNVHISYRFKHKWLHDICKTTLTVTHMYYIYIYYIYISTEPTGQALTKPSGQKFGKKRVFNTRTCLDCCYTFSLLKLCIHQMVVTALCITHTHYTHGNMHGHGRKFLGHFKRHFGPQISSESLKQGHI